MKAPVDIVVHDLSTATEISAASITTKLIGSAETPAKDALRNYLLELHSAAAEAKADVIIDLHPLKFMNSSCFNALVSWIAKVQDLAPEARYRITFLSDDSKYWQSRSMAALAAFAEGVIQVKSSA